ncbi:hypothetical protein C8F01DRAFT_1155199 [Mycena amicta]|nr:hypothetical protein C8F01DRAFT_1155199 [Mycena amicta]
MSPTHSTTTPLASTSKTAPPCASSPAPDDSKVLAESSPDESDVSHAASTSSSLWSPPPNSLFPDRVRHPLTETPICHVDYHFDSSSSTSFLVISAADIPEDIPASNPFEQEGGNTEPYPVVEGTKKPIRRSWYSSSASPTPLDYLSPERLGRRSSPSGSADEEDSSSTSSVSSPTTPRASTTVAFGAALGGFGVVSADGGPEESDDELAGDGSSNGETSAVFPTSAVPPAGFLFGLQRTNFFGRLNASVFAVPTDSRNGNEDDANELAEEVDAHASEEFPAVEESVVRLPTATVASGPKLKEAASPAQQDAVVESEGDGFDNSNGRSADAPGAEEDDQEVQVNGKRSAAKQLESPKKKSQKLPDVDADDAEVGEAQQREEDAVLSSGSPLKEKASEDRISTVNVDAAYRGEPHKDFLCE